jgi:hypothetical protein
MTNLLLCLLPLLQGGDKPPDEYRIQITFDDKDRDPERLGLILRRRLAEFAGVRSMHFDPESRILTLSIEVGSFPARVELEEALPREFHVGRFDVLRLPGIVSRHEDRLELAVPGVPWRFRLEPTDASRDWFDAVDRPQPERTGWAVSGTVTEKVARRGSALEFEWTLRVEAADAVPVPRTRQAREREEAKRQSILLHVLLEDLVDGPNSGDAAAEAVKRIEGVVDASYDPMGMMLAIWLDGERRIDVDKLRAAVRDHASATRILVDGLYGMMTARTHGPYMRTVGGMEFRIEGRTDAIRDLLRQAGRSGEKVLFRVSGEIILVEDKILIVARVVRPAI